MNKIEISDSAYEELKVHLKQNKIEGSNIRINITGSRCSGAKLVFEAAGDTGDTGEMEDDFVEEHKDIKFIIRQGLLEECSGFTILSSAEGKKKEIFIKPTAPPKRECRLCGRGCP